MIISQLSFCDLNIIDKHTNNNMTCYLICDIVHMYRFKIINIHINIINKK